jgi:23S rRNA (uracil1939-C5)-methyltransferase
MRLKAETAVYGGYVIARGEGVVFIKGALPGETVEAEIAEKKKDYSIALVREVLEPSPARVEAHCRYYGLCGGCQLQHVGYGEQVSMKSAVLADSLRRLAGIEIEQLEPLTGPQWAWRRRAQLKVRDGDIGFYKEGTREVVPIERCPNLTARLNESLLKLRAMKSLAGVKELHLTEGDGVVALIRGREFDETLAEEFIQAGFDGAAFGNDSYRGKGYVLLDLNGLEYSVSPWSFFQSNWELNLRLVEILKESLSPLEGKKILDIYAGGGNFSIPLASGAERITAVEENAYSVKDGMRNLELNSIKNVKFIKSPVEKFLSGKIPASDIAIVDPPRPGLGKEALSRLLALAPERLVYISCNPSTLARDLKKLAPKYRLDSVRMVDFFPNTFHVESVSFLSLIK